ncbi:MAG: hydroxymethylglutaryl-CoA lyase [Limnochordaceae bacterium]|nr:hydroxymethylglutaryl-CoA lyase [Limnochordaceae bacterium]
MPLRVPAQVHIVEVGPRDGLQIEPRTLSTADKVALIDRLSGCGALEKIEAGSFVRPDLVPQMADSQEVFRAIRRRPPIRYMGLVGNSRGAERAIEAGVDEIDFSVAASETFNRRNVRKGIDESLEELRRIVALAAPARAPAPAVPVWVTISTAFGCPYEGEVPADRVLRLAEAALEAGAAGVVLADTTGMAYPTQVGELVRQAARLAGTPRLGLHFHNTRGAGLANVLAALDAGAVRFDGSIGGIGGCPFAPGATGNVCTEDMVHMLHAMGVETGIDLSCLVETARWLEGLLGRPLPGQVMRAGPRSRRYPVPEERPQAC